jgi:hypothetical protein
MLTGAMNLTDLTANQLKRAAGIKEQIEKLNKELSSILGLSTVSGSSSVKAIAKGEKKIVSRATRAKLSAKLKAYWAAKRAGKR